MKREWRKLVVLLVVFLVCYLLPVGRGRFDNAVLESLHLVRWYAREHVILCLLPAFFIAGAIVVFVSQQSVMKYLGAKADKVLAYGVASVSGTVLAVCSCTVLPLFAGIYRMPRLIELGSVSCIPCKMMAPILEELREEYAGKLQVEFLDVKANPAAGEPYGIRFIPTQIFLDAEGQEFFRHEGFFPK